MAHTHSQSSNTTIEAEPATVESPRFAEFYTLPYSQIVKPETIWPVNKYFLRRWVPYLGPSRFWLIITAQQTAFQQQKDSYYVYDANVYTRLPFGRAEFYRLKSEMSEWNKLGKEEPVYTHDPLSLFIARDTSVDPKNRRYLRDGNVTKQNATWYWVRRDQILTPGDAAHLKVWLLQQGKAKKPNDIMSFLNQAAMQSDDVLLAPSQTPYVREIRQRPYTPYTVLDIVSQLYDRSLITPDVVKSAELLHLNLTKTAKKDNKRSGDYLGTHYFLDKLLPLLGPGPGLLLVYLQAGCFKTDQPGEERNTVSFTYGLLADYLQVSTKTVARWVDFLENIIQPHEFQPYGPLLKLLGKTRTPNNDVAFTYRVELNDPLHPSDLPIYEAYLRQLADGNTHAPTVGTPEGVADKLIPTPEGVADKLIPTPEGVADKLIPTPEGVADKLIPTPGGNGQIDTTSRTNWDTIKYYKHYNNLLNTLSMPENTFYAVVVGCSTWKIDDERSGLKSFAQAAYGDIETFCQQVGIMGQGIKEVINSGLTLEQLVAWYLYATQNKLTTPPGFIVSRARLKEIPPCPFEQLATLSWELWRVYAVLTQKPVIREDFALCPGFREWMDMYDNIKNVTDLPCGVGEGVLMLVDALDECLDSYPAGNHNGVNEVGTGELVFSPPTAAALKVWAATVGELQLQMTQSTFNTWLKDAQLVGLDDDGATYVVGVRNSYAQEWLHNRLGDTIKRTIRPLAKALDISAPANISLHFVVVDEVRQ